MSKSKKILDNKTLPLPLGATLARGCYPPAVDVKNAFIQLLNNAAAKSKKKREAIAEEISMITGRKLSPAMLNNYLESSEHKEPYDFPAWRLQAFCTVCGDLEPLLFLLRGCGLEAANKDTIKLARLGQIGLEKDKISNEEQYLKLSLTGGYK